MTELMNLSKVSANGQITIPAEIRKILDIKSGDKVLFSQNDDGSIVMSNASQKAIIVAQKAFKDAANTLNVKNDEDVINLVNEVRYGK